MGKGEKIPDQESESLLFVVCLFVGLFLNCIKSLTRERR